MRPIDADALVDMLQGLEDKLDKKAFREVDVGSAYMAGVVEGIKKRVKDAPTIDYEPVLHGEWIHDFNNLYGCSVCFQRETMSHKAMKRYCPRCGAKMD